MRNPPRNRSLSAWNNHIAVALCMLISQGIWMMAAIHVFLCKQTLCWAQSDCSLHTRFIVLIATRKSFACDLFTQLPLSYLPLKWLILVQSVEWHKWEKKKLFVFQKRHTIKTPAHWIILELKPVCHLLSIERNIPLCVSFGRFINSAL